MKKFKELVNKLEQAEKNREVIQSKVREKNKKLNQEFMKDNISEDRAMEIIEMTTKNELDLGLIEIDIKIHDLENEVKEEFLKVISNLEQVTKEEIKYISSLKNAKHFNAQREIIKLAKKFKSVA